MNIPGRGHIAPLVPSWAVLGLVVGLGSCQPYSSESTPKLQRSAAPNIVLLIVDTLRPDKLGCYGFPLDTSPELDVLAKEGVLFENVIAQSSWTRPSIASMVTARHPRSIGIYKPRVGILDDHFTLLSEILKENGYTTIGLTANPHLNRFFNFNQGFDH